VPRHACGHEAAHTSQTRLRTSRRGRRRLVQCFSSKKSSNRFDPIRVVANAHARSRRSSMSGQRKYVVRQTPNSTQAGMSMSTPLVTAACFDAHFEQKFHKKQLATRVLVSTDPQADRNTTLNPLATFRTGCGRCQQGNLTLQHQVRSGHTRPSPNAHAHARVAPGLPARSSADRTGESQLPYISPASSQFTA